MWARDYPEQCIEFPFPKQMMQSRGEDGCPNLVLFGAARSGKSALINTLFSALNSRMIKVTRAGEPTLDFVRYDNVLFQAGDVPTPFTISDTTALRRDDGVMGAARNIIKGRYRNNSKMDNGWRCVKAMAHESKRVHGVVLVVDATGNAHFELATVLAEICAEEDELPCAVAWTRSDEVDIPVLQEKVRSMILSFPRAVNFPVRAYTDDTVVLNPRLDGAVLECFEHIRRQAVRYMRYAAFEASVKLPLLPPRETAENV
jgi:hypothetical protein